MGRRVYHPAEMIRGVRKGDCVVRNHKVIQPLKQQQQIGIWLLVHDLASDGEALNIGRESQKPCETKETRIVSA